MADVYKNLRGRRRVGGIVAERRSETAGVRVGKRPVGRMHDPCPGRSGRELSLRELGFRRLPRV